MEHWIKIDLEAPTDYIGPLILILIAVSNLRKAILPMWKFSSTFFKKSLEKNFFRICFFFKVSPIFWMIFSNWIILNYIFFIFFGACSHWVGWYFWCGFISNASHVIRNTCQSPIDWVWFRFSSWKDIRPSYDKK